MPSPSKSTISGSSAASASVAQRLVPQHWLSVDAPARKTWRRSRRLKQHGRTPLLWRGCVMPSSQPLPDYWRKRMTRMRRNHGGWLLVALCLSCLWRSSEAVVLVEDAINEANTLQALIKTQTQVEQQLRMLQNQATALENDAMNLKQSPLALLGQLQSLWGAYNAVLNNARGLGFQL